MKRVTKSVTALLLALVLSLTLLPAQALAADTAPAQTTYIGSYVNPANAPSRSTICSHSAPQAAHLAAISAGSSAKTVSASKRPSVRRTQRPPRISIAGYIIIIFPS